MLQTTIKAKIQQIQISLDLKNIECCILNNLWKWNEKAYYMQSLISQKIQRAEWFVHVNCKLLFFRLVDLDPRFSVLCPLYLFIGNEIEMEESKIELHRIELNHVQRLWFSLVFNVQFPMSIWSKSQIDLVSFFLSFFLQTERIIDIGLNVGLSFRFPVSI